MYYGCIWYRLSNLLKPCLSTIQAKASAKASAKAKAKASGAGCYSGNFAKPCTQQLFQRKKDTLGKQVYIFCYNQKETRNKMNTFKYE